MQTLRRADGTIVKLGRCWVRSLTPTRTVVDRTPDRTVVDLTPDRTIVSVTPDRTVVDLTPVRSVVQVSRRGKPIETTH